jgi:hypothetical protein
MLDLPIFSIGAFLWKRDGESTVDDPQRRLIFCDQSSRQRGPSPVIGAAEMG